MAETRADPMVVATALAGAAAEVAMAHGDINYFMFWLQFLAGEARR